MGVSKESESEPCVRVPSPAAISNALLDVGRDEVLRIEVGPVTWKMRSKTT